MKQRLRFILFEISVIVTLTILSCKKEEHYMNNAEISVDNRESPCLTSDLCNCPGGFFVFIDNVSNPNGNSIYKAFKLPSNFIMANNFNRNGLPIKVKIDWKFDMGNCNNIIDITRIEKR